MKVDNLVAAMGGNPSLYGVQHNGEWYIVLGISEKNEKEYSPPMGLEFVPALVEPITVCCLKQFMAENFCLVFAKNCSTNITSGKSTMFVCGRVVDNQESTFTCGYFRCDTMIADLKNSKQINVIRVPWSICPVHVNVFPKAARVVEGVFDSPVGHVTTPPGGIVCMSGFDVYFYRCDGFDDAGWGCAYRVTQTIASWWKINFGIIKHVPSILEIQQILNKIDNNTIGAKTWIGSFEAALVLGHISSNLIECRILHLKDFSELKTTLQTIVRTHFLSVGCPVLVGAGDFAYTIAGITDESVLILDPHLVFNKKLNFWQSIETFFGTKKMWSVGFINMCLPRLAN